MITKLISIVLIVGLLFAGLLLINVNREEKVVFHDTYTHAVCSGNTCRDFLVACSGAKVVSLTPISGFVTFGNGWSDKRAERELC